MKEIRRKDWKWDKKLKMYAFNDGGIQHYMDQLPKGNSFHRIMGNHSKLHPRIKLDMKRLTMTVKVNYPYEIDLTIMTSAVEVLDWIFQVMNKTWADDTLGSEFIHALEDATRSHFDDSVQGVFCPFGNCMDVDWKKRTYKKAI